MLDALRSVIQEVSRAGDLQSVLEIIVERVREVMSTEVCSIYLKDESEGKLTTAEAREKIRAVLPVKAGVALRIATSRGRHGSSGVQVELSGDERARSAHED